MCLLLLYVRRCFTNNGHEGSRLAHSFSNMSSFRIIVGCYKAENRIFPTSASAVWSVQLVTTWWPLLVKQWQYMQYTRLEVEFNLLKIKSYCHTVSCALSGSLAAKCYTLFACLMLLDEQAVQGSFVYRFSNSPKPSNTDWLQFKIKGWNKFFENLEF